MNIQEVIQTINQEQADGVIENYAIGGAVGDSFHLEPVSTLDSDGRVPPSMTTGGPPWLLCWVRSREAGCAAP